MRRPEVVIVHDYLTQRGGAERVVLSIHRAFPQAPVYVSLFDPAATYPDFGDVDVRALPLDRIGPLRRHHRLAFPLLAAAFSRCRLDAAAVVCSTSGWAHGVATSGRKIVYCHSPARWLYQGPLYGPSLGSVARGGLALCRPALERWDRRAAGTAARYLTNSSAVRDRISATYGIDAEVLPPPPALDPSGRREPVSGLAAGFHLVVSRLLAYKNVAEVVSAFAGLPDERLVVVGSGPDLARLRGTGPPNVRFHPAATDEELRWLYGNACGVIAAAYEDYGLTPLEAAAAGVPVAALRFGGYLDTVREGETGVFFERPEPAAIRRAIEALAATRWDAEALKAHAATFSEARFVERLQTVVADELRTARAA